MGEQVPKARPVFVLELQLKHSLGNSGMKSLKTFEKV